MTPAGGVTVGRLLQSRPEALGLDLEVVAGSAGLGRTITSPYVQKTGLALAGFHEYIRPGRVFVFGNSEVAAARDRAILVEMAARNQLLRWHGRDAARAIADRLEHQLQLAGFDELDDADFEDFPDSGEER